MLRDFLRLIHATKSTSKQTPVVLSALVVEDAVKWILLEEVELENLVAVLLVDVTSFEHCSCEQECAYRLCRLLRLLEVRLRRIGRR